MSLQIIQQPTSALQRMMDIGMLVAAPFTGGATGALMAAKGAAGLTGNKQLGTLSSGMNDIMDIYSQRQNKVNELDAMRGVGTNPYFAGNSRGLVDPYAIQSGMGYGY